MKIYINQVPSEGLTLQEQIEPSALDLDTDLIKFHEPLKVKADVSKITNALTVDLSINTLMHMECSRCLCEFDTVLEKKFKLNFVINKTDQVIDLDPEIRDQIIIDYPINPLCSFDCKGLCPNCGKNLNEGRCSCGQGN